MNASTFGTAARQGRRRALWAVVALAVMASPGCRQRPPAPVDLDPNLPTVGMEGRRHMDVVGVRVIPRHVDRLVETADLVVRIERTEELPDGKTRYYLAYKGFVPGEYDLRDHLMRVNDANDTPLPSVMRL